MKYIFGNWKMNNCSADIDMFASAFENQEVSEEIIYGLALPFPYIKEGVQKLGSKCMIGAQNTSFAEKGAWTGEVSASMLADCGVQFCLVGHSERRTLFQEKNNEINQKIQQLLNCDITPMLCIGETEEAYQEGKTQEVLKNQLSEGLNGLEVASKIIIAYEPVWAIGTGRTPTPEEIKQTFIFIKKTLKEMFGENEIKVLYGGSVKPSNAESLLSNELIDGALVGGASLVAKDFLDIGKNSVRR